MRKKRRISTETTIHDVAQRAGVSIATVSLSLRGNPRVSEATRKKVVKAARELDYKPNVSAQGLAGRKTNLIAVWGWFGLDSLKTSTYSSQQILIGILQRLKGTPYGVYISDWTTMTGENRHLLDTMDNHRLICGSIWITPTLMTRERKLVKTTDLPVAIVEATLEGCDSLEVENEKGAYLAATHLLKRCPRLAVAAANRKVASQLERLAGVKRAAREAGLPWRQVKVYDALHYSYTNGEEIALKLVKSERTQRGRLGFLSLAGDRTALGVLAGLRKAGIEVPGQVALVGWDDNSECRISVPSLSTVRQPFFDMGYQAAELLLRRVENTSTQVEYPRFEPELILRESG